MITVLSAGPLTTVQDLGRSGFAHLGVPRAGALDAPAAALANRLVGNARPDAVLETALGGLRVHTDEGLWFAVTGAPASVTVDGQARGHGRAEWAPAGSEIALGIPATGVRTYIAVAGGVEVPMILGSRSTDTLAWVGPPPVAEGQLLPVGPARGRIRSHDTPRPLPPGPLHVTAGPRSDWFAENALEVLCSGAYAVRPDSNRVGLRLAGTTLARVRDRELASEGLVLGAVQVPPDGLPVVLLNDHPVTGGYPVVAVVEPRDLWQCAQLRPGETVQFTRGR